MDAHTIQSMIQAGMPDAIVQVDGDDGVHFSAVVISDEFEGKRKLARHRAVYATLGDAMGGDIHALALTTVTPAEWEERKAQ